MQLRADRRPGFTLTELLIVVGLVALLAAILIPTIFVAIERTKRFQCASNLRQVGVALLSHEVARGRFPRVYTFAENVDVPWSRSWWFDILPYTERKQISSQWQSLPGDGDFNGLLPNPNINLVDGFNPGFLHCPSSHLPLFTNPRDLSDFTRALVKPGTTLRGIFVPSYVAISGSAPDMRGLANGDENDFAPHGRNTRDGRFGVLSGSGVFPPQRSVTSAMIQQYDGLGHVIMVGEQSGWTADESRDPAVWLDQRSAWPRGMFTGAEARYGMPSTEAEGIDGDGDARIFNATTVRYPINTRNGYREPVEHGIITDPRPAQDPRLPGPGHNHGIFSAHEGAAHVLYADGHVELLSDEIDLPLLKRLVTIDDGGVIKDYSEHRN